MTGSVTTKLQGLADARGRKAGSIDVEIGQRIRRHRNLRQMSQEELAARLGISCQQLQKYEGGANRISASRLIQLARVLSTEISLFLKDGTEQMSDPGKWSAANDQAPAGPGTSDMLLLMNTFGRIANAESRSKIIEMATFLANLETTAR